MYGKLARPPHRLDHGPVARLTEVVTVGGKSNGVLFCRNGDRSPCRFDESGMAGLPQSGLQSGNLELRVGVRTNGSTRLHPHGEGRTLLSRVHLKLR